MAAPAPPRKMTVHYVGSAWSSNTRVSRNVVNRALNAYDKKLPKLEEEAPEEEAPVAVRQARVPAMPAMPAMPVIANHFDDSDSDDYSDDYSEEESTSGDEPDVVDIEMLVARLGWSLASDHIITAQDIRDNLAAMNPFDVHELYRSLTTVANELKAIPELSQKRMGVLLQFAALGGAWTTSIKDDPSVADFLENEIQPVDLQEILEAATRN